MKLPIRLIAAFPVAALAVIIVLPFTQPQPTGVLWEALIGGRLNTTAVNGDGTRITFGSSSNVLMVYDAGGSRLWEFEAANSILGVDTTSDGLWTAVASEDRNAYLLDADGLPVWQFKAPRSANNVAVADDGSLVAVTSNDRSVYGLDAAGNLVWQDSDGTNVRAVDVYGTGDKARAVVGTDASRLTIYSRSGQSLLQTYLDYAISDVAVTPNGARIAVGTADGTVTLVHGGNGSILWQAAVGAPVQSVALTGSGDKILVGTDKGRALLLDDTGQILQTFEQEANLLDVAIARDGSVLTFAGVDGKGLLLDEQLAAAAIQTSQLQRSQLSYGIVGLLAITVVAAGWSIRSTERGRLFWKEYTAGPRLLLMRMWRARLSYLFILPTILLLATFNYYPAFSGLYHAFTDWKPGVSAEWVGLDNFAYLLQDRFFWAGFLNAVILVIVGIARIVTVPLLAAELIFHVRHKTLRYIFRTLFIVPIVLPMVVEIMVWNNIYDPNIGLLNQTLIALGLEDWTQVWYGDARVALLSIIFIGFPWVDPFALLVFYGGLIGISDEVFDAAKVDGASGFRRFWHIDVPLLLGQARMLTILTFISTVQTFELVFLTTGGGPGSATYTPALELYLMATRLNKMGVASAIGIILFVIILAGTFFSYRSRREATNP